MRRPLTAVILAIFILSMTPQPPVPVTALTGPQYVDDLAGGFKYGIEVSTTKQTVLLAWIDEYNHLYYMVISTSTFETIKGPDQLISDAKVLYFATATNGTHYMVVADKHAGNHYDVYYIIIDASNGEVVKGPEALFSTTDSERNPVVEWGGDYWLVAIINKHKDAVGVTFIDKNGEPTGSYQLLEESMIYDKVDKVEPRIAYNPNAGKFAVVASTKDPNDIILFLIDPGDLASIQTVEVTNDEPDDYKESKQGAVLAPYGDGFIVFWANSDKKVKFANVSSDGATSVHEIGIAQSSGIWPDITTSVHGVVVAWKDSTSDDDGATGYIRVTIIKNNNYETYDVADKGYYPSIARISPDEAVVVYGDGSGNVIAHRIDLATGALGDPVELFSDPASDIRYEKVEADDKSGRGVYGYCTGSEYSLYWGGFEEKDLPEAGTPSAGLLITSFKVNDVDGDTYIEAGDTITVEGELRDQSGNVIPDETINVYLYRHVYYNKKMRKSENISVAWVSGTTDANGRFSITLEIPGDAVSGIYYVVVEYPGGGGNDQESWCSIDEYGYIPVVKTGPAEITWTSIPLAIEKGPALLIQDGQVIITDPVEEVRTNNRMGKDMTEILGNEADDVDIASMQLAIDQNYLYVKAEFAGNVEASGSIAPVLAIALDFTPKDLDDGYKSKLFLIYGMGNSQTYLKDNTTWHVILIATPKDNLGRVFQDEHERYTLYMLIAFEKDGQWYHRELAAGHVKLSGSTMEIYAPLDVIKEYNPYLETTGKVSWKMFSAVYAVDLTNGEVKGAPGANWFDVPGVVTYNSTPSEYLELGIWESPLDDKYDGCYELDIHFILNIDRSENRFFGYTETYITATNMTVTGFDELRFDGPRSFVGTVEYIARLRDANNTYYYVYGKTLELYMNGSSERSATTDAVGIAELIYTWSADDWKKNHTICVKFAGDTDYVAAESKNYSVSTLYLINITNLTYEFIDNDRNGLITCGDQLKVNATVVAWDGEEWDTAPDGIGVKFVLHSPEVVLGTNTTKDGKAMITYTFTGDEHLFGNHTIYASGDGDTSWTPGYPGATLPVAQQFSVVPLPEAPVMPIILLAALLLFIIVKKRK